MVNLLRHLGVVFDRLLSGSKNVAKCSGYFESDYQKSRRQKIIGVQQRSNEANFQLFREQDQTTLIQRIQSSKYLYWNSNGILRPM